ncbi:MAG: hypothetical protein JO061_05120 [Acidobacteriaceae bacterium]|nr:hypothetical protein [Acidobacteriaceae bacterium]
MKQVGGIALGLVLAVVAPGAFASTLIDFEAQATSAGSSFTGTPDSPLSIGVATFTGGELLNAEFGLADQTSVYASEGVFGTDSNPITIQFSHPVDGFSLLVANGGNTDTFTISDNLGDKVTGSLASAGAGGSQVFTLPGDGLSSVAITSSNVNGWNFAIDNVAFTETPEPKSFFLTALAFLGLGAAIVIRREIRASRTR